MAKQLVVGQRTELEGYGRARTIAKGPATTA
jgi:hypothetical protein